MKVVISLLTSMFLMACQSTPYETAQQLVNSHEYAGAIELLNAQGIDTTNIESLSLRAKALIAEGRVAEGLQDVQRIAGIGHDGQIHAAGLLVKSAGIIAREKIRAKDAIALLDSAVLLNPSTTSDVVGLAWQRGLEFLNASGDAGRLFINCAIKYDSNSLGRLRAHDVILARRYEELESLVVELPNYANYGRKFFTDFGKFPVNLLEIQTAYPEAGLRTREGWDISIDGREGKIVAIATSLLGNRAGVRRGTVLVGG